MAPSEVNIVFKKEVIFFEFDFETSELELEVSKIMSFSVDFNMI